METDFKVKIDAFEGPLELLLELIEKRKLFINDISLAQVADDYIKHVEEIGKFPVEQSAHFILVASTLLLIKSKSLLPTLELSEEEQESISDLEDRLKQYQQIKGLSLHIHDMFGKQPLFTQSKETVTEPVFSPSKEVTSQTLLEAVRSVLSELPIEKILPKVLVKKIISLDEVIENLTQRIKAGLKISFNEFAKKNTRSAVEKKEIKVGVIISFLAMLELVKRGGLYVRQDIAFGDIELETGEVSVPKYGE